MKDKLYHFADISMTDKSISVEYKSQTNWDFLEFEYSQEMLRFFLVRLRSWVQRTETFAMIGVVWIEKMVYFGFLLFYY